MTAIEPAVDARVLWECPDCLRPHTWVGDDGARLIGTEQNYFCVHCGASTPPSECHMRLT